KRISVIRSKSRGTSGPTTTKPTFCFRQKEMTAELSDTSRSGTQVASPELVMPGFPGAHSTELQEGEPPPLPPGATEIEGLDSDVTQRSQSWRLWIWFEGKEELRVWLVVAKLRGATEEEGEVEVMVMTSGDQEILLSLEHDSQGFTIARAGDNVAIAFQETDAYQVMSREENALAGNQFHKMLSMLGESESKVDNP
ncbi:hypothetical protein HID58_010155, partial [Brassica napus]